MAISSTANIAPPTLPRLNHPDTTINAWADALVRSLSLELQRLATPVGTTPYTVTGATPSRALAPLSASTLQVAQVVATLIADLKTKGAIA